jgi:hypothetical protein
MYSLNEVKRAKNLTIGDVISDSKCGDLYIIISLENTFWKTYIYARPVNMKTVYGATRVGAIFREPKWKKINTYKEKKENESNLYD